MQLYLELHLGDFTRETAHWDPARVGWYVRLLMAYYRLEGPVAHADRYECVGARARADKAHVDAVLRECFALIEGVWRHLASDADIADRKERSRKARESVEKRWDRMRSAPVVGEEVHAKGQRRKADSDTNVDTNVLPTKNGRNTPHLTTLPIDNPPDPPLEEIRREFRWGDQCVDSGRDFLEFLVLPAYPKVGRTRVAVARRLLAELWGCEGFDPGRFMRGLMAYSASDLGEGQKFCISLAKFVEERRWEDYPDDVAAAVSAPKKPLAWIDPRSGETRVSGEVGGGW